MRIGAGNRGSIRPTPEQLRNLSAIAERRNRTLRWAPSVTGVAVFAFWMALFGYGTDWLEGTRFDLMAWLDGLPPALSMLLGIGLGYGVAISLAMLAYVRLRRRLVQREVAALIESQGCLSCGYSLQGLTPLNGVVICPECGTARAPW
jgi:hypothetical protein